jgi:hypothetical protein
MTPSTYSYRYRPSFGQGFWMIEFCRGDERKELLKDFMNAITELRPTLTGQEDKMIFEVSLVISSNSGNLDYTVDEWGGVFVEGDINLLNKINEILRLNDDFEGLKVNVDDYNMNKNDE